ncbi:MAG: ATP synthase F1 subunit epsilon [Patescibacteria group bacterium]|nr:ATP synthase F1 subunit epsilon [Patescibacteria group bacterium]
MASIKLELTTPERNLFRETVDAVTLPTLEGEITVLPNHVPLVAVLVPGMMTVKRGAAEEYVAVSGGFIEVQPGSQVVILADTADRAEELDIKKVEEARERAQKLLEEKRDADDVAMAGITAAIERETARLKVIRRHRGQTALPHVESAN